MQKILLKGSNLEKENNLGFDKLNFLTAGMPLRTGKGSYKEAFAILEEMNLDGMELEFVHGLRISENSKQIVKQIQSEKKFVLTCHAPFYINLNSKEPEKIAASIERIVETAKIGHFIGAFSITFHAAFYLNQDKAKVFDQVAKTTNEILQKVDELGLNIFIRPETTGKATQWGSLEEIIELSKLFPRKVLPCVDFSHLHARSLGQFNTYKEFAKIFETIGNQLSDFALENFHCHLAGIEYGQKGEKFHLNLEESDMNYKELLKAFLDFNIKGALVCESPNIEDDAKLLKEYYLALKKKAGINIRPM